MIENLRAGGAKLGDGGSVKSPLRQQGRSALTALRRGATDGARRTREARRRRRLDNPVDFDEGVARPVVAVQGRFTKRQHRCEARVVLFENLTPLVARFLQ